MKVNALGVKEMSRDLFEILLVHDFTLTGTCPLDDPPFTKANSFGSRNNNTNRATTLAIGSLLAFFLQNSSNTCFRKM